MKSRLRFNDNKKGIECLNCHQPLSSHDNFCSNCGQVNDLRSLSIKKYVGELFSGFFAFDTRTFRTLGQLLFKPGKVSLDYIRGERMKYVNPFQLYLHTSIVFFFMIGFFSSYDDYNKIINPNDYSELTKEQKDSIMRDTNEGFITIHFSEEAIDSLSKSEVESLITSKLDSLFMVQNFKEILADTSMNRDELEEEIQYHAIRTRMKLYSTIEQTHYFVQDSLKQSFNSFYISEFNKHLEQNELDYLINEASIAQSDSEFLVENALGTSLSEKTNSFKNCKTKDIGRALDSLGYERSHFNIFLFKKTKELGDFDSSDKDMQKDFIKNLISKSSIVVFFMLPLFVVFVLLFYLRKKMNYTEHLVFVFNNQTVFFILLFISVLLDRLFHSDNIIVIMILVFVYYLYRAIRTYYQESRFLSILKLSLLGVIYLVFLNIGAVATSLIVFLF